jgi:glucose-1-phosphate cytidylyltransferase
VKAVILCGGLGTRMKGYTKDTPKPLLQIGEHPILWHIMMHYSVFGFKDFVLCLGYKAEQIRSYFNSSSNTDDWNVHLQDTGVESPTGLRLKKIRDFVQDETFLATYGDSLTDVSINRVIEFHQKMGRIATVVGMKIRLKFGLLTSKEGFATEFAEKPVLPVGLINAGFFVFHRKIFDYLDDGPLEARPIKRLIEERQLAVYEHEGVHRGIDTSSDLEDVNEEWKSGKAPWKVW